MIIATEITATSECKILNYIITGTITFSICEAK